MYNLNQIELKHISNLNDLQLTKLLHKLLQLEGITNQLSDWESSVPFNIITGDAGSDGRAMWNGSPKKTKWLPNNYTIFQNKATNLIPSKCKNELLNTEKKNKPRTLKTQIQYLADKNGGYVLFTNQPINDNGIEERIKKFREAFSESKHPNANSINIKVYDANKIKDWVNENISAVTLVQRFNDIHRPLSFIGWEKWGNKLKTELNTYQKNNIISSNIELVRDTLAIENVIRIYGHSGLGKTRLAFESINVTALRNQVVYYDLEGETDISELKKYLISYQESQQGIIIIDNCEIKSHLILSALVKDTGSIKIITIGLDDNPSVEDKKIKLDRNNQRDITELIVRNKIGATHSKSDLEYVTTLSEGYPWMAIKFCDSILKKGMSELNKIPIDIFIKKLIFGTNEENELEYNIIRACSVFSAFGFLDDSFRSVINEDYKESLKKQTKFIQEKVYDGQITDTKFREICQRFLAEDIIERKGTFYIIRPTILAINLAADWLKCTPPEKIIKIIENLKNVGLEKRFIERFADLDQIDKAKDLVKELWGTNSLFGSAEVLNTNWGSLLFRYVVEVNPIATSKTLFNTFEKMSIEELLNMKRGRRNLVGALEKLCFRKESFNKGAKTFLRFAVAENESWGNNSTNQFIQLFQIFLPGTEVNFKERLKILEFGLKKENDDYTKIIIDAAGRGLVSGHLSRIGNSEKQGSSKPLIDYEPNSWTEVYEYWTELIKILTQITCSENIHADYAKSTISRHIRGLIKKGQIDLISLAISKILSFSGKKVWFEALDSLKMTLNYENYLPTSTKDKIENLLENLSPKEINEQLFYTITQPEWQPYKKQNNTYIDEQRIKAETLAEHLVNNKIEWMIYLGDLLKDEQRQAFSFGKKLGEFKFKTGEFIDVCLKMLENTLKTKQNPDLVFGYILGLDNKKVSQDTLEKLIKNPSLRQHSFNYARILSLKTEEIFKLFILIDEYDFPITHFRVFQYGRALDHLTVSNVKSICRKIYSYDKMGKWTALSIMFMFSYGSENRWETGKNFLKLIISSDNLIVGLNPTDSIENYHWSESVRKLLSKDNNPKLARKITEQLIAFCKEHNNYYSFDTDLKNIIDILINKYFKQTWSILGEGLVGDYLAFFHLKNLIGTSNGWMSPSEGILFMNEKHYDPIINWCRKHPTIAPIRIASMMPLTKDDDKWHPFSKRIIDEFGNSNDFLNELSANMGTFGTVGSRVAYFVTMKKLFTELLNHKFDKVRDWAEYKLEHAENQIKVEQLSDEQRFL